MTRYLSLLYLLLFLGCQKELRINPGTEAALVANAGPDREVQLPGSALLDGRASYDPGGRPLASFGWSQLSGPSQSSINSPNTDTSAVGNLVQGIYLFQLTVRDLQQRFAMDTVRVTVRDTSSIPNRPPVAMAGADQDIVLPSLVVLRGDSSFDPDGQPLATYQWLQVAGPNAARIISPSRDTSAVDSLQAGVYRFELTVLDVGGLTSRDTVQVRVSGPVTPPPTNPPPPPQNVPPVAIAGPDLVLAAGQTTVLLDASASYDTDGTIASYRWAALAPSLAIPANTSAAQTNANNLVPGNHLFELAVTDNAGATARDTVRVTSTPGTVTSCDGSNRPHMQAQLSEVTSLGAGLAGAMAGTVGNKIFLAGGSQTWGAPTGIVAFYDVTSNSWIRSQLSEPRHGFATAVLGNKVFFAGGNDYWGTGYSRVDIYDATANTWSTAELSVARTLAAAVVVGNKILFAGGQPEGGGFPGMAVVDIYDGATNSWSTTQLSTRRSEIVGVEANGKAYFSGGLVDGFGPLVPSHVVDVYDPATNSWSVRPMTEPKVRHAGVAANSNIYWAGGLNPSFSDRVERFNTITGATAILGCLSQPRAFFDAVRKADDVVFFSGYHAFGMGNNPGINFDIYHTTSSTWSIGLLPQALSGAAIVNFNGVLYVAGGYNLQGIHQEKLWRLDW